MLEWNLFLFSFHPPALFINSKYIIRIMRIMYKVQFLLKNISNTNWIMNWNSMFPQMFSLLCYLVITLIKYFASFHFGSTLKAGFGLGNHIDNNYYPHVVHGIQMLSSIFLIQNFSHVSLKVNILCWHIITLRTVIFKWRKKFINMFLQKTFKGI